MGTWLRIGLPQSFRQGNLGAQLRYKRVEWSGRRDLNPRPSAPQADALPVCATARFRSQQNQNQRFFKELGSSFRLVSNAGKLSTGPLPVKERIKNTLPHVMIALRNILYNRR